jgi:hypothetical protein
MRKAIADHFRLIAPIRLDWRDYPAANEIDLVAGQVADAIAQSHMGMMLVLAHIFFPNVRSQTEYAMSL